MRGIFLAVLAAGALVVTAATGTAATKTKPTIRIGTFRGRASMLLRGNDDIAAWSFSGSGPATLRIAHWRGRGPGWYRTTVSIDLTGIFSNWNLQPAYASFCEIGPPNSVAGHGQFTGEATGQHVALVSPTGRGTSSTITVDCSADSGYPGTLTDQAVWLFENPNPLLAGADYFAFNLARIKGYRYKEPLGSNGYLTVSFPKT